MFVSCVQRRVVEGSGVGSVGCVVHFDVHACIITNNYDSGQQFWVGYDDEYI